MVVFEAGSGSSLVRAGLYQSGEGGWLEVGEEYAPLDLAQPLEPRRWSSLCLDQGVGRRVWVGDRLVHWQQGVAPHTLGHTLTLGSTGQGRSGFVGDLAGLAVWPLELGHQGWTNFSTCLVVATPSIVSSTKLTSSIKKTGVNHSDICKSQGSTNNKLFEKTLPWQEAMEVCQAFGSSPNVGGMEEMPDISSSCQLSWLPVKYTNNTWLELGKEVWKEKPGGWSPDQPESRSCVFLNLASRRLGTQKCSTSLCHFCGLSTSLVFSLTGLCPGTVIDTNYTISIHPGTGAVMWRGYGRTDLVQNIQTKQWEIVAISKNRTVIGQTQQDSIDTEFFPLGLHKWNILNDTCVDLNSNEAKMALLLSVCSADQFSCSNGLCVPLAKRCDLFPDCADKSDEDQCHVLSRAADTYKGYEVGFPTLPSREEELNLTLSVDVLEIVDVKDLQQKYIARVKITLEWFDVQVKYINLNNEHPTRNFLATDETGLLWMPQIVMSNSEKITPTVPDISTVIYVKREGNGTSRLYPGEYRRATYYEGGENPLTLVRTDQLAFFCNFDYHWFPFDTQTCDMRFKTFDSMQESVNIVPVSVTYQGQKELMVFNVIKYAFVNISQQTDEAIVQIRLVEAGHLE